MKRYRREIQEDLDDEQLDINVDPIDEPDEPVDPDEMQTRPNKYKFRNLDEVMNPDNYDSLPEERKRIYTYKDSRGAFTMGVQRKLTCALEEEPPSMY